jgi:Glycoside hydrolase 123, catalytic domain/Glycoside hydrolase 123 N-terminal domain
MVKTAIFWLVAALALTTACRTPNPAGTTVLEAWVAPIEVRIYRGAFSREPDNRTLRMAGLAGEVLSAQLVARSSADIELLSGTMGALAGPGGAMLLAAAVRVRYGGFVPVDETMAMTADALLEDPSVSVGANLAQPVWISVDVPQDTAPGVYAGIFTVTAQPGGILEFDVELEVLPAVLPPAPEWSFYLNIWQDPTPVAAAHGVGLWSEEHWRLLEAYAKNFAEHGLNSIMTHIIYEPWGGVRGWGSDEMVVWKYPGEFRPGGADQFEWDFSVFDRYVSLMIEAGVQEKIDMYALVKGPGGTLDASIRYLDTSTGDYRWIEMDVGQPIWEEIWKAFLPMLREHLKQKGWFDKALLGFDEKPEAVMKIIFDFIIENAPDFMIASSGGYPGDERKWGDEIVFHLREMQDEHRWREIQPLVHEMAADERYVSWYTACRPHYPNTFLFSSLRESRLIGWLTWKYGFEGYTRWAVNLFPDDTWNQPMFTWPSGDMFFVYPGERGPLDSMRWELLRQGIQDYEALKLAMELAEEAGRGDLLEKLDQALRRASIIDSCSWIPYIELARAVVNDVIRELGSRS